MTAVYLDMEGRLHWFIGVPPQREPPAVAAATPDWTIPFREAGLDIANFQPVASTWVPLHAYDARAAWDGVDPAHPENKVHVEAAAFRGKLTYFETVYPWDQPLRQEQPTESRRDRAVTFILITVVIVALIGSSLLARRNLRLGRGDRRGATRIAFFYLAVKMLVWLFGEHHNGLPGREFSLFLVYLSAAVFTSFFLWLLYVALEPFVRRRWPKWIISWSRLLAGGYRDPLVGRDILIGATFGVGMMLSNILARVSLLWIGQPVKLAIGHGGGLIGAHLFPTRFGSELQATLFNSFIPLFLLLLFVFVLRREWLAFGALWLLLTVLQSLVSQATGPMLPFEGLLAFLVVFVLYRYGLLAMVSAMFFLHLWVFFPMTTELTVWYATDFVIALVISIALAVYGFYISLAGQSLFAGRLLED
jgi:serine/threonine-protein kinase